MSVDPTMHDISDTHLVLGRTRLRAEVGEPGPGPQRKAIYELDEYCERLLALSPFAVLSTADSAGRCDASPRGGPPGFLRVLSPTQVAWGELPGNKRFDGAQNIAENAHAALLVIIPGMNETLRIEGHAQVTMDQGIREATALDGKLPWGAVVLHVEQAFTHCGKAFIRSGLWDPKTWPTREDRPRIGEIISAHIAADGPGGSSDTITPEGVDESLEKGYRETLWSR